MGRTLGIVVGAGGGSRWSWLIVGLFLPPSGCSGLSHSCLRSGRWWGRLRLNILNTVSAILFCCPHLICTVPLGTLANEHILPHGLVLQVEEGKLCSLGSQHSGELRQTCPARLGGTSHPTPTPTGLMVADGTTAQGDAKPQGSSGTGTQTWITVCLGFFFNSMNMYYFVQGLGEILSLIYFPSHILWRILPLSLGRKGTLRLRPQGLLVKGPVGASSQLGVCQGSCHLPPLVG